MTSVHEQFPFVEVKVDEPFFKTTGFPPEAKVSRFGRWLRWRRRRPQPRDFWRADGTWDANSFHRTLIWWRESKPTRRHRKDS